MIPNLDFKKMSDEDLYLTTIKLRRIMQAYGGKIPNLFNNAEILLQQIQEEQNERNYNSIKKELDKQNQNNSNTTDLDW